MKGFDSPSPSLLQGEEMDMQAETVGVLVIAVGAPLCLLLGGMAVGALLRRRQGPEIPLPTFPPAFDDGELMRVENFARAHDSGGRTATTWLARACLALVRAARMAKYLDASDELEGDIRLGRRRTSEPPRVAGYYWVRLGNGQEYVAEIEVDGTLRAESIHYADRYWGDSDPLATAEWRGPLRSPFQQGGVT
jgi:hypothetical protein